MSASKGSLNAGGSEGGADIGGIGESGQRTVGAVGLCLIEHCIDPCSRIFDEGLPPRMVLDAIRLGKQCRRHIAGFCKAQNIRGLELPFGPGTARLVAWAGSKITVTVAYIRCILVNHRSSEWSSIASRSLPASWRRSLVQIIVCKYGYVTHAPKPPYSHNHLPFQPPNCGRIKARRTAWHWSERRSRPSPPCLRALSRIARRRELGLVVWS
jgi:hypothetical protein